MSDEKVLTFSRRKFLGGLFSLAAVTVVVHDFSIAGNMPSIKGDGQHDDTQGLGCLLRNEPVVVSENLRIDSHGGVTFHRGVYRVSQTIDVPADARVHIEGMTIEVTDLPRDFPAFMVTSAHRSTFASTRGELSFRADGRDDLDRTIALVIERGRKMKTSTPTDFSPAELHKQSLRRSEVNLKAANEALARRETADYLNRNPWTMTHMQVKGPRDFS